MRYDLYEEKSANYPRIAKDKLFVDYRNEYDFNGYMDKAIRFIEDFQLKDSELWGRFVRLFKDGDADDVDNGWRGEYWGKMMRGAAFTYSYTKNAELYSVLESTVRDIMSTIDADGRISTYTKDREFDGWDIWSRKYVLLGMQYFIEICEDETLKAEIVASMCRQADYIISKIGKREDGKKPITVATRHWRGLNSSSLLEPIVRLFTITGEEKYFDFATYIVGEGGTSVVNVFDLAYENKLMPYQYPSTKAYEMTSCFEGLLEYYRHTGNERYKTAIINFADAILATDFTIIGCCGCTHELFDHSTVRQANTNIPDPRMQETCVTVTLMKYFYQLTLLTGETKYVDAFERSLYNAYLGAINTEKVTEPFLTERYPDAIVEPLPFDSYSPLVAGVRGVAIGGMKMMKDNRYYGCCACIGAAGNGLVPKMTLLSTECGFALNLYFSGKIVSKTKNGTAVTFLTDTEYPKGDTVKVTVIPDTDEEFELLLRNPAWSEGTRVLVNGKDVLVKSGYVSISRRWSRGDTVEIVLDMRTKAHYPIPYGHQVLMNEVIWGHNYIIPTYDEEDPMAKHHVALTRGPIVLAQESRLGYDVDEPVSICIGEDKTTEALIPKEDTAPYEHIVEVSVPLLDGGRMTLTDYASAGKLWSSKSKMAAWILTK